MTPAATASAAAGYPSGPADTSAIRGRASRHSGRGSAGRRRSRSSTRPPACARSRRRRRPRARRRDSGTVPSPRAHDGHDPRRRPVAPAVGHARLPSSRAPPPAAPPSRTPIRAARSPRVICGAPAMARNSSGSRARSARAAGARPRAARPRPRLERIGLARTRRGAGEFAARLAARSPSRTETPGVGGIQRGGPPQVRERRLGLPLLPSIAASSR